MNRLTTRRFLCLKCVRPCGRVSENIGQGFFGDSWVAGFWRAIIAAMADGISEIAPAANPRAPHRLRRRAWKHPRPTVRLVACRTKRRNFARVFRRLKAMHIKCMLWFESCLLSQAYRFFSRASPLARKSANLFIFWCFVSFRLRRNSSDMCAGYATPHHNGRLPETQNRGLRRAKVPNISGARFRPVT
jgi:hypothetical protein